MSVASSGATSAQQPKEDSSNRVENDPLEEKETGKLAVIDTGGTFGMEATGDGPLQVAERGKVETKLEALVKDTSKWTVEMQYIADDDDARQFVRIDSSGMTPAEWRKIGSKIKDLYQDYDGFIIIHGTDTLAHTAAALKYMLRFTSKPVVVTGAQIPIFTAGTDAIANFLGAFAAVRKGVKTVSVFFNDKLMVGNAVVKVDSVRRHAFGSPRKPLLGEMIDGKLDVDGGVDPSSNANDPTDVPSKWRLSAPLGVNAKPVGIIKLYPGIDLRPVTLSAFSGVVLECFGVGNGPCDLDEPGHRERFVTPLREFLNSGGVAAVTTECLAGKSMKDKYSAGVPALHDSLSTSGELTTEATFAKLVVFMSLDPSDSEFQEESQSGEDPGGSEQSNSSNPNPKVASDPEIRHLHAFFKRMMIVMDLEQGRYR